MNSPPNAPRGKGGAVSTGGRRRAARLAAVQALYEMDVAGAPADAVLREFLGQRWTRALAAEDSEPALAEPDAEMFSDLVRGVAARRDELDATIEGALAEDRTVQRLEVVLRAILRAGAYELLARLDVPPRVSINEYINVAYAFFAGSEPALVNGVLDRVARTLRPEELKGNLV